MNIAAEAYVKQGSVGELGRSWMTMARMKADLLLFNAELLIMRSRLDEADKVKMPLPPADDLFSDTSSKVLDSLIQFAREQGFWGVISPRVTFAKGMLFHALDDYDRAFACYQVVAKLSPSDSDLSVLAQMSTVILRLGRGDSKPYEFEKSAKDIVAASATCVPSVKLAGLLVEALVGSELVKAKCAKSTLLPNAFV
jgi:hypothetical protein